MKTMRSILLSALLAVVVGAIFTNPAHAIPQFARTYGLDCTACHTLPPMLNARGLDFWQRGLRPAPDSDLPRFPTAPFAMWATVRQEDRLDARFGELYVPRVEFLSGGPILIPGFIEENFSYFVEWRTISLESRRNGTLLDRSGRFEDAYIIWLASDRLQLQAGIFRSLNQVDVSRRLMVSEPIVFSTSLPGDPVPGNARVTSLRAFAPSGRSPGFQAQYQSIKGESAADGLFHLVHLPFVGEWSLPVTPAAQREASFVTQGPPKGAFLETYYRQDLNSIGAHAFIDNDRWLFTMAGQLNYTGSPLTKDVYLTGALGWDDSERTTQRTRSSIEALYIPRWSEDQSFIPGCGFRAERVTGPGTFPAYVPFAVVSFPTTSWTLLLQTEYRHQEDNRSFFLDMSVIF